MAKSFGQGPTEFSDEILLILVNIEHVLNSGDNWQSVLTD